MTRVRLGLVIAIAVLATAPAGAARGRPVEGGASFNDAPLLTPGRYSDTIRAGETLYYGIELAAGQRLVARAVLTKGRGRFGQSISDFVELGIVEPDRNEHSLSGAEDSDDFFSYPVRLAVRSGVAGEALTLSDADPGIWFLALDVPRAPAIRKGELNVDLTLEVRGRAVPSPAPTSTPQPSAIGDDPAPGRGSAAPPAGDSGGSGYTGLFVAMFVVGAVGGSLVELVRAGRAGNRP